MLFYLTNAALDITLGVTWWVVTKTSYGIYNGVSYLIYGNAEHNQQMELKDLTQEIKLLRHELNEIKKIEESEV